MSVPVSLILLFLAKHLICDFFLQSPYQALNKHKFFHPGGLLHALINGIGTCIVLALAIPALPIAAVVVFGIAEALLHYTIDLTRTRINHHLNWKCQSSEAFWWLIGIDQSLHWLIYVLIMTAGLASITDVELVGIFAFATLVVVVIAMVITAFATGE
jgi:hypothetical protein